MARPRITTVLRTLGACGDAIAWAEPYGSAYRRAWAACPRGDWLLWLLGMQAGAPGSAQRKRLVLAVCACARLTLPHAEDPVVRQCVETAERWARGEATLAQLKEARAAATDASWSNGKAHLAIFAAEDAANVACDARSVVACNASFVAEIAARTSSGGGSERILAHTKALAQCAGLVRQYYPDPPAIRG